MQPDRIGPFEIVGPLGAGAMGVVYRARDPVLRRDVALKRIRPDLSADAAARGRFLREARAAAALNHPGIATIYQAGETADGQLYFASELIEGETLRDRLARGRLSQAEVLELGQQLCEALAAAHAQGVLHRDIKPANLMLDAGGRLKILDFGLARLAELGSPGADPGDEPTRSLTRTRQGVVVGSPAYMSPEQAAGETLDPRSDVFSAGCVLYEMACGRSPFAADSVGGTLRRVLAADPPSPETVDPEVDPRLASTIRKALAKEPDARFASIGELGDGLRGLREGPVAGAPPPRRRRRRWATLAGLILVLSAAAAVFWWSGRPGLAFGSRDQLLIASVDNRTGDAAFDLALRTALEADLQQSPWASVFDQSRVAETLQLMRKDPTTPVDEALGRDLCRFAGVRALLLPRILAVGEAFELQAILVDPVSGRHVDRIRVRALGKEQVLLEAIDELSREVRSRLGESLDSIAAADRPVSQVTTSSWEALHFVAKAHEKWAGGKVQEAAALFEQALERDPEFAVAKGSLGLLCIQFLGQRERGQQLLREALAASGSLPEWERLMIGAVHRQFVDEDVDGALQDYALISDLYPDAPEPLNNRGRILLQLGRYEEAAATFEKAAEMGRVNQFPLVSLYWTHLNFLRQPARAEQDARRLLQIGPDVPNFLHFLSWSLAAQGKLEEALPELRRTLELEPQHPYAQPNLAHVLLATGRADEAVAVYRELYDAVAEGRLRGALRLQLRDLAIALVAAGRREEAERLVADELERARKTTETPSTWELLLLANLAVVAGRAEEAGAYLERADAAGVGGPTDTMMLACALALAGRRDEALDALSRALDGGYHDPYFPRVMPPFHALRDDPRFLALFRGDSGGAESRNLAP